MESGVYFAGTIGAISTWGGAGHPRMSSRSFGEAAMPSFGARVVLAAMPAEGEAAAARAMRLRSSNCARTFGEAAMPSLATLFRFTLSAEADREGHTIGRSFSVLRTLGEAVMPSSPVGLYWALA